MAGHTEEGHTTMECLQAAIHMRIGVKDPSWVDGDFRQTLRRGSKKKNVNFFRKGGGATPKFTILRF